MKHDSCRVDDGTHGSTGEPLELTPRLLEHLLRIRRGVGIRDGLAQRRDPDADGSQKRLASETLLESAGLGMAQHHIHLRQSRATTAASA